MDAAFTEEQHEIRRTLRELLLKRCGPDEVKAAVRTPPGYDTQLWQQLAGRLGLPGLALPTAYGGVGCGPTELALACEETGRVVLPHHWSRPPRWLPRSSSRWAVSGSAPPCSRPSPPGS